MADDKKAIFKQPKSALKKCAKGMDVRKNSASAYELYGKKTVEAYGRKVDGMYFGSIVLRKNAVSLYFFPIYTHPQEFKDVSKELRKAMSGKSCFQIKKDDKKLLGDAQKMLLKGKKLYKKIDWI